MRGAESAWRATALYAILAIATTWPLLPHLTRSLPMDLGDGVLNCWILSWGADHVLAWIHGDLGAFRNYWQAPIFHPAPLTLAYSEHLFAQAVQIAPLYALTGNIVLCYNVLFISTYVLSALGMYLLVRELTGDAAAAWVGGACFGFALVRLAQTTHLQVLSAQWMPFALFALRRYFTTGRAAPLAGAIAALVAQNLSCGYYLVFFTPVAAAYCLFELADRGLWRRPRVWFRLTLAAGIVGLATWPFVKPYLMLRALGFDARSLSEVRSFSADVLAFATASAANRVWGWLRVFVRPEGELFPGLVTPVLAVLGLAAGVRAVAVFTRPLRDPRLARRRVATALVAAAGIYVVLGFVASVGFTSWKTPILHLKLHDMSRLWGPALALSVAAFVLSRRVRGFLRGIPGSALGFYVALAIAAAMLAWGPTPTFGGLDTALPAPYAQLFWHVPGYDGLRVPARYGMITALAMAVLAGIGAHALRQRSRGRLVLACLTVFFLVESTGAPMAIDHIDPGRGFVPPPPLRTGRDVPTIYRSASELTPGASLIELPLGIPAWDVQSMFYQPVHRLPIVNGYSGGFPVWYMPLTESLAVVSSDPSRAWNALVRTGATHAIVHREAYRSPAEADVIERWLSDHGGRLVNASGPDRLFALPLP